MREIKIYKNHKELAKDCLELARGLPEYFNEEGYKKMEQDLVDHELYTAMQDGRLVGFITIYKKNQDVAEISWMAVDKEKKGKGIGSELLEYMIEDLRGSDHKLLEVKTLSEIDGYEPYKATREFYRKHGFILLETICPYPGWGEDDPCAIYVKILRCSSDEETSVG